MIATSGRVWPAVWGAISLGWDRQLPFGLRCAAAVRICSGGALGSNIEGNLPGQSKFVFWLSGIHRCAGKRLP